MKPNDKQITVNRCEFWKNTTDLCLPGETWKVIEKYNGKYMISSLGRVKNTNYRNAGKERIVPQQITNRDGYLKVSLEESGQKDSPLVHDLVAHVFLVNPCDHPCVNHKDGIHTNNVLANLEWCTKKYNSNYGDVKEKLSKAQSRPVLQFTKTGEFVAEYKSIKEAASALHCSSGTIIAALKGATSSAKGFCWKYKSNTPTGGARRAVEQYSLNGAFVREYASIAEAAKSAGCCDNKLIHLCLNNKRPSAYGYVWRYKN